MNLLGIDFEDWYHPQLVSPYVPEGKRIPTMFKGLDKILDLLRKNDSKATFFLVGEILENNPEIIDKILSEEHEIGFHTMRHTRLDSKNFQSTFKEELNQFEDIISRKVLGFRAPTFSLNEKSSWAIDELVDAGYKYDSSIMPAKTSMYGLGSAEKSPYLITSNNLEKNTSNGILTEFPLLVTKFLGKTFPAAGTSSLRLGPSRMIQNSMRTYEKQNILASLNMLSWELTPEHIPKIRLPGKKHFITFHNIEKTFSKINNLLQEFEFSTYESYLSNIK